VILNDIAHSFPAGHRLRVSISMSYWPIAWPAPEPATLTVYTAASALELPVRPSRVEDSSLPDFEPPESAAGPKETELQPMRARRTVTHQLGTGKIVHTSGVEGDDLRAGMRRTRLDELDLEYGQAMQRRLTLDPPDPLSARAEHRALVEFARDGWRCATETRLRISATATEFRVEAELRGTEGETTVFERRWDKKIPRDLN
jgi:predicted acyl esterase